MSNNLKYGLIGSLGRLGSEVRNVFNEKGFKLVFGYDIEGEKFTEKPDVLIDCSLPDVFSKTISFIDRFKVPLVIATTGLNDEMITSLKEISKDLPVVQSYNYSIGIQILLKLTEIAKEILSGWDVEITETHHRFKKDKPSGTAKMIKEVFNDRDVNISSLRLGNVAGDHTVYFGGLGEVLSITHSATSRRTFAEGILRSAEFAVNQKNGFYSFHDVMFSK
ncbi:MAG: dihydrodipicolinate reductase C-terminal domain-containing protein [Ignavibacteriaceae bacterium]|jgi:4-hydroxy-tetrahydrodipicolinate reductase